MKPFTSTSPVNKVKGHSKKSPRSKPHISPNSGNATKSVIKKRKRDHIKSGDNTKPDPKNKQRKLTSFGKLTMQQHSVNAHSVNTVNQKVENKPTMAERASQKETCNLESSPYWKGNDTSMSDIMEKLNNMSKNVDDKLSNIQNKLETTESKVENNAQTLVIIQQQMKNNENRISEVERHVVNVEGKANDNAVKLDGTEKRVGELHDSIHFTQNELDSLKSDVNDMKTRMREVTAAKISTQSACTHECNTSTVQVENQELTDKIVKLENYSRRNNIIIEGLTEPKGENPHQAVAYICHALQMPIPHYERVHRLGKPNPYKPRPLIIRLSHFRDKVTFFQNTRFLRGNARSLIFKDDLAPETKKRQAELQTALMYVKRVDKMARFINDKILFRGRLYGKEELANMPGVEIDKACCLKGNGTTVFSGELCPLSNLFSVNFEIHGKRYQSNEHFYQSTKCLDFGKPDLVKDIMAEPSPRQAMYIGRQVKPDDQWLKSKGENIMRQGIEAKFRNEEMKKYLISTTGTLGEATKHKFWGIGHTLHTDGNKNIANWYGENTLGKMLTELRENIKKQS